MFVFYFSLGMWHDGFHDGCPDRVNLMSGYSTGGPLSLTWSHCSIESVNTFIRYAHLSFREIFWKFVCTLVVGWYVAKAQFSN